MKASLKRKAGPNKGDVIQDLLNHQVMVKKLDAIIDSSFDGLWISDREGGVVKINKASEKINDIKAEQVIGKKMDDLVREGLIDRSVTREVLKNGTTVTLIQHLKNGKRILVTGNPVFDDRGELDLVVVNERDITTLIKLRNELDQNRALTSKYRSELSLKKNQKTLISEAVVRSEAMCRVFNTCMKVAQVDSTILMQGESGVGKGFCAKLVHKASRYKNGPFIRVDCGAIPESLIESELFGYEKGAFTGALTAGKPGQFELAERGTLFLDEVGDLPINVQIKLLRFLEENQVIRVGGITSKSIETRVIAATNRNLDEMVRNRTFRKDLFFRLNVVPIHIPPLRKRVEDIPALIELFLKQFNEKYSAEKVILPRAIDCLRHYSFPGNIRELSNLVEQVFVLAQGSKILLEDFPIHVRSAEYNLENCIDGDNLTLHDAVENVEKRMIVHALRIHRTQRKAARFLGIDQSTLARKAKRYGIKNNAIMHQDE